MINLLVEAWKGKKWRIIIPFLHFVSSFFYDRTVFVFELDKAIAPIAMNGIISDRSERIFGYLMTKLLGALFIYIVWFIVWFIIDNRRKWTVWVFVVLGLIPASLTLYLYPYFIDISPDTYMTYTYAVRFLPDYWHSAYSGIVFSAFLTVIPSPAFMSVIQTILATAAIGYLFHRITESEVLKGKGRWLIVLFFLIYDSFDLFASMHRMSHYSILCIFFLSILIMDIIDKKKRMTAELILMVIMAGFVSVWRTEGIIIGVISILVSIIWNYGKSIKEKAGLLVLYFAVTVIIMIPQKLGDMKYYGSDYRFMNSFNTITNILNDTGHNLGYDGIEEDLDAIDRIVPIPLVAEYGTDGYRRYNYAREHYDINQSLAGKAEQEAFSKAYYNLVLHNVPIYLKTQVTNFASAAGFVKHPYVAEFTGEHMEYPGWELCYWDYGKEDILHRPLTIERNVNMNRQLFLLKYYKFKSTIDKLKKTLHHKMVASTVIILSLIFIAVRELVMAVRKKKSCLYLGILSMGIIAQLSAILLVMPSDFTCYLHGSYFSSVVIIIIYFSLFISGHERLKNPDKVKN